MELQTQLTDKEDQAHSNEETNCTPNEKNHPTDKNETSKLQTQQSRNVSSKETFQQADMDYELSVSQNFIGSDEKLTHNRKKH